MLTPYLLPVSCKGIVVEDGKIWLRHNERNEWELPGGKLDPGEQPAQTVKREMLEELGVEIQVNAPIANYLYTITDSIDESHGVFVTIYSCHFIKRVGGVEHIGEAGASKFESFSPNEINGLNMPEFYKSAITACLDESQ
jgi:8-oxo-dGTP pyrophosphatase MutT (NUDIX family)